MMIMLMMIAIVMNGLVMYDRLSYYVNHVFATSSTVIGYSHGNKINNSRMTKVCILCFYF